MIGNLKSEIVDFDFAFASLVFVQQRDEFYTRGAARFQICEQIRERQSGIDNIFNDDNVAGLDWDIKVLKDAHFTGGSR